MRRTNPLYRNTTKAACEVVVALLMVRHLLLEAMKAYESLPEKQKDAEPGCALLLELEPQFYFQAAGALMHSTFGAPDSEGGKIAYKALKDLLREDMR